MSSTPILAAGLALPTGPVAVVAAGAGVALVLLIAALRRREGALWSLAGFRAAAYISGALALLAALGTLIHQGMPHEQYLSHYGSLAGTLILALGLNDLFHSIWFGALIGGAVAGIAMGAILRWPITLRNAAFFSIHLGLLVILAGAGLSALFAVRGRLDLRAGEPPVSQVEVTEGRRPTGLSLPLGHELSLRKFDVTTHETRQLITLYRPDKKSGEWELAATFEPTPGVRRRLSGKGSFMVVALHAGTEDLAPNEEVAAKSPHLLTIGEAKPISIELEESIQLGGGHTLRAVRFFPHFTFDLESKTAKSLGDEPKNPALEVEIDGARRFLFSLHEGHQAPSPDLPSLKYRYAPANAAPGASAGMPSVELELLRPGGTTPHRVTLPLGPEGAIEVAKETLLAFEERGAEIKSFRSHLLVDGREPASVAVNHPLNVGSWLLYQVNFDPNDPDYSGLEAVRDPGVVPVFIGFALLFGGILYLLLLQPRFRRDEPEPEHAHAPEEV